MVVTKPDTHMFDKYEIRLRIVQEMDGSLPITVIKIPEFGGDSVQTVISNIPHPMGIAGFPAKIAGSYGVVVGISIQSPVNILISTKFIRFLP